MTKIPILIKAHVVLEIPTCKLELQGLTLLTPIQFKCTPTHKTALILKIQNEFVIQQRTS